MGVSVVCFFTQNRYSAACRIASDVRRDLVGHPSEWPGGDKFLAAGYPPLAGASGANLRQRRWGAWDGTSTGCIIIGTNSMIATTIIIV